LLSGIEQHFAAAAAVAAASAGFEIFSPPRSEKFVPHLLVS